MGGAGGLNGRRMPADIEATLVRLSAPKGEAALVTRFGGIKLPEIDTDFFHLVLT